VSDQLKLNVGTLVSNLQVHATDEHMKMLNLGREWITTLLPYLLSRMDRVHYGVHSDADLVAAMTHNKRMARSRKLLAVPFVGKDTPSRTNEFSHPDVRILCHS
jgi:hypothetical protein